MTNNKQQILDELYAYVDSMQNDNQLEARNSTIKKKVSFLRFIFQKIEVISGIKENEELIKPLR